MTAADRGIQLTTYLVRYPTMLPRRTLVTFCFAVAAGLKLQAAHGASSFDVLIRGGTVIDGSGMPGFRADVGVRGDTIAIVGNLQDARARRSIDARGKIVVPGFIDLHNHAADVPEARQNGLLSSDRRVRSYANFVAQGVTTVVTNQDGFQPMDLDSERRMLEQGTGVNVALLAGHEFLRERMLGADRRRRATETEIAAMRTLLRRELDEQGAFGLSSGLEYDSMRYSDRQELLELTRETGRRGLPLILHLRSQGSAPMWYVPSQNTAPPVTVADAVEELIAIAERTGTVGVFTHFKLRGQAYRGTGERWIEHIRAARERGARLYLDVYPYQTASSDAGFCLIPDWVLGNERSYAEAVARVGRDPERLTALLADIAHEIDMRGGAGNIRFLPQPQTRFSGKSLAEIMVLLDLDAPHAVLAVQRLGDAHSCGGSRLQAVSMDEHDVRTFYGVDWSATSSDGTGVPDTLPPAQIAQSNPRNFGTYPRRLSRFVGQLSSDSLEHAVRSCTGLPAEILGLRDRGLLHAGYRADLAVIDVAAIGDNQVTPPPPRYPTGIEYVLVNGRFAVDASKIQFALAGRVLSPPDRDGTVPNQ